MADQASPCAGSEKLAISIRNSSEEATPGIDPVSDHVRQSLESLDESIPRLLKIRYLLLHAYKQLKGNPEHLRRWLNTLLGQDLCCDSSSLVGGFAGNNFFTRF